VVEHVLAGRPQAGSHDSVKRHPRKEVLDEGKGSEEVDAEVSRASDSGDLMTRNWLTGIHLYAISISEP